MARVSQAVLWTFPPVHGIYPIRDLLLTWPGPNAQCACMMTAIAVAAALAVTFALGSLVQQVDGATLRRWRLSRRWDVSRLAREFIKAADEPLATLRGLMHMINAWERGARRPSERYWLLYLQVFPECANGEAAKGGPKEAGALAAELPGSAEVNATEAAPLGSAPNVEQGDIRALAATVRALERQIAGLSRRVEELSRDEHDEGQLRERRTTRPERGRWYWTPLWIALVPSLAP
jgi:hypothetical protein